MSDYYFNFAMDNEEDILSYVADRLGVTTAMPNYPDFEDAVYMLLCILGDSMDDTGGKMTEDWFVPFFRRLSAEESMFMSQWASEAGLIKDKVGTAKAVASTITPLVDAIEDAMRDTLDDAAALAYEARGPIWTERADND